MKNILYILILISATTFGQTKVSEMPAAGSVADPDLIMVVQGGTNKKATKAVLQETITDDITLLEAVDVVLTNAIIANSDDISDLDDSVTVHRSVLDLLLDNTTLPGPSIDSAVVKIGIPDTVYVYYDQTVFNAEDTALYDVIVLDGYPQLFTPIIDDDEVKIPINFNVTVGVGVSLQYFQPPSGGVVDVFGNQAASQAILVTNNIQDDPATATLKLSLPFNGTIIDDAENYTVTKTAGFQYSTDRTEGALSANFDQSGSYVTVPDSSDVTGQQSFWFAHKVWGTLDYYRTIFEVGGLELKVNAAHGNYELWSTNVGGDSAMAYSDSLIRPGEWMGIAITVDSAAGEAHFWIDAVDADIDSIFRDDFVVKDLLTLGADDENGSKAFSYVDLFRRYNGLFVQVDIDTLQRNIISPPEDTTGLRVDSSYAGYSAPNLLVLKMTRQPKNSTLNLAGFTYYVDDVETSITSGTISGSDLLFTVDSLTGGEDLRMRYDSSGISNRLWDSREIYADTFDVYPFNFVESTITTLAHYKVNENMNDDLGANDATGSGSETYNSAIKKEGSRSLNNGFFGYGTTPVLALDSVFSVSWWAYSSTAAGNDAFSRQISTSVLNEVPNIDGFEGGYDFINGHPIGYFHDGSTDQTINGTAGFPTSGEWIHIVMSVNMRQGTDSVWFYVNGQSAGAFDMVLNVPTDEQVTIGRGRIYVQPTQSDDHQFQDTTLTLSQAQFLYNNPGERIPGGFTPQCECGGVYPDCYTCPEPDDIFNSLWTKDFDHWVDTEGLSLPVRFTGTMLATDFWGENFENSETNGAPYDSIVVDPLTSSPGLKIDMLEGEYNSISVDVPNHDGGESTRIYWDDAIGPQREVYFSYNVMFNKNFNGGKGGKLPGPLGWGTREFVSLPLSDNEGSWAGLMFKGSAVKDYLAVFNPSEAFPGYNPAYPAGDYLGPDFKPVGNDYYGNDFLYSTDDRFLFNHTTGNYIWYNITRRVVMNLDGTADGFIEDYINGYLIRRVSGIEWQGMGWPDAGWNGFYLTFFFGGSTIEWAAATDSWAIFDDFTAWSSYKDIYINSDINRVLGANNNNLIVTPIPLPNWPKE